MERQAQPRPVTDDPLDAEFWQFCQLKQLRFQRCGTCGTWRFLPRYMCARCGAAEFDWAESAGRGRIFSWTVTYQPFHPAFAADIPCIAAVVELDEGVRMATRLLGCDPNAVVLDMPVALTFKDNGDGYLIPCFKPANAP